MSHLIIRDLDASGELDMHAMSRVCGGNRGMWVFGWINPYSRQRAATATQQFFNPVFNIQVANQTISGNGPITAINAPVAAPSTVLNENLSINNISTYVTNMLDSSLNTAAV
ncbi:hypothetical protein [Thiothrix nivea]|uniref:Uncharacterized protein n=1 Tax=Thiothrix nivea (strain ATCC 35100 / DSM 5205 / JP2) TaxID=870187 RepID=A0A656HL75_THINJ|nr:hypothetical protein [Thiothrix nivea]EIJ37053.1 hypothetical protein Thini_0040 [Thiothrix nivea DSM 5205]